MIGKCIDCFCQFGAEIFLSRTGSGMSMMTVIMMMMMMMITMIMMMMITMIMMMMMTMVAHSSDGRLISQYPYCNHDHDDAKWY